MTVSDRSVSFAIWGPITRADLPGLCKRVCGLLGRPGVTVAYCDVAGVDPDVVTVDALARLQLAASRRGCQVRLQNASDELCALVSFMGLQDVLPDYDKGSNRPPARLCPEWLAEPPSGSTETSTAV